MATDDFVYLENGKDKGDVQVCVQISEQNFELLMEASEKENLTLSEYLNEFMTDELLNYITRFFADGNIIYLK